VNGEQTALEIGNSLTIDRSQLTLNATTYY